MASSLSQFSDNSDETKSDWKIPLAKLNSPVIQETAKAKEEINQLLLSGSRQCHVILGDLFNQYVMNNCSVAGEILLDQSQQSHVNVLFEKMTEGLKHPEKKYPTLMLLWNIIQRQPSWLHTIISTAFFNLFIKCLKVDNDVVILTTGILIITSLLPSVPSLVGSLLVDFYDIFERIFLFTARKRGITPDTHLLHLKVAVYVFFHRLYAMYPNNTVAFLKSFYESNHGKDVHRAMEFLCRWVKFHPWLVMETEQTEIGRSRWRSKEPHDVLIDCEKMSLEPSSCQLQESDTLSSGCTSRQSSSDVTLGESSGVSSNSDNSVQPTSSEDERQNTATQTGRSLQNATYEQAGSSLDSGADVCNSTPLVASSAMVNSPTTLCSLSTPPSSKNTSPSGSVLDVSIGRTTPVHLNSSHQEGGDPRLTLHTPTPLDQSRRSSLNHHTANSFAVIDDSSTCGRSTPPIVLSSRNTPPHKAKGNTSTYARKDDKKGRMNHDLELDDATQDLSSEQKSEIFIRTPPAEKCMLSKFLWDVVETLQPFTTNICRKCLGLGGSGGKTADWESQLSPAQLLDHYLMFGQSLQKEKLNSIPLTGQEGTDWTHFGGSPPKDEMKLLRKELLLLQSQLLFERHKCELHATRNRRLVGKVFQANAIREELVALKEQLNTLQKEISSLEQSCKEKVKENRQLKERMELWNTQQQDTISILSKTNEVLRNEKIELEGEVQRFRADNEELQEELKESKAKIFRLENDLSFLRSLEKENAVLKSQVDSQAKNLLIMGEREQKLQDLIHVLRTTVEKYPQHETQLHVYRRELEDARTLISEQKAELMFSKLNVSDLDTTVMQKEHEIKDLKKSIESIKKIWNDKLDAVESKYQTIKRANQRLESEVMSLHSKLDARKRHRDKPELTNFHRNLDARKKHECVGTGLNSKTDAPKKDKDR